MGTSSGNHGKLPSEGKGRTFESYRVRQFSQIFECSFIRLRRCPLAWLTRSDDGSGSQPAIGVSAIITSRIQRDAVSVLMTPCRAAAQSSSSAAGASPSRRPLRVRRHGAGRPRGNTLGIRRHAPDGPTRIGASETPRTRRFLRRHLGQQARTRQCRVGRAAPGSPPRPRVTASASRHAPPHRNAVRAPRPRSI